MNCSQKRPQQPVAVVDVEDAMDWQPDVAAVAVESPEGQPMEAEMGTWPGGPSNAGCPSEWSSRMAINIFKNSQIELGILSLH